MGCKRKNRREISQENFEKIISKDKIKLTKAEFIATILELQKRSTNAK